MDPALIAALLVPAASSVVAAISKWIVGRRESGKALETTVTLHDARGHEVVLHLEGIDAAEVANAIEAAVSESSKDRPSPAADGIGE